MAISDDITDRKLAEEALAKERSLLRTVIDNLPDFIFAKDTHSRFILNNRAHAQFLGAGFAADVLGKSDQDFFQPELAETYIKDDHNVMHGVAQVVGKEEPIVDRSGARRWISTTKVPLKRPDGKIIGLVGLSRDITEKKKGAERMERMMGELARSNSELEQFAYVASHDLQEPLRKIQAFSSRLRDRWGEQLGEQGADYLNRVENAAARMQILIEDLLAYSRVTSKAKPFVPVELSEVVEGVLSDLEARIERLNARVDIGPLPQVAADPTQMRQLLQNLIGNALKFHRQDSTPVVRIHADTPDCNRRRRSRPNRGVLPPAGRRQRNRLRPETRHQDLSGIPTAPQPQRIPGKRHRSALFAKRSSTAMAAPSKRSSAPGEGATFVVTLPLKQIQDGEPSEGDADSSD